MKHNSIKKKRGARSENRSKKKEMKTPFTITIIVLILFVVLVIFSVLNGPIEKESSEKNEIDNLNENNVMIKRGVDESVRINMASASNDISKCENNKECEDWYYLNKAKEPEDCNKISNEIMKNNCIEELK